jgi:hypothetical protein
MRSKFCVSIFFLCLFAAPVVAQSPPPPPPVHRGDPTSGPADMDEAREQIEHDMAKKAAKERVAALKTDTDKLLKLSVELKAYVDKSDENVLSLDVIKKAEEIEKLAKSVKDKMKGPN